MVNKDNNNDKHCKNCQVGKGCEHYSEDVIGGERSGCWYADDRTWVKKERKLLNKSNKKTNDNVDELSDKANKEMRDNNENSAGSET